MKLISNPASFSSVRSAFNTEGFGISNSLYAYRKGGGIVPNTSLYNPIGGDPLRLSQFSNFIVPFRTSLTEFHGADSGPYVRGYSLFGSPDINPGGGFGSVSNSTINLYGGGTCTFVSFFSSTVTFKAETVTNYFFSVSGNQVWNMWNTIYYNNAFFFNNPGEASRSYDSGNNKTDWFLFSTNDGNPTPFTPPTGSVGLFELI